MLDDPLANPTIQPRSYGKDEGISYAIVQHYEARQGCIVYIHVVHCILLVQE
jgi:hypothetical protein